MGYIGSDLVFPHNHIYAYDDFIKELKLCAGSGQSYIMRNFNYDDDRLYDEAIKNSNVVINLTGSRAQNKLYSKAVYANINVA